jgi:S1-C subfamily serine protease
VPRRLVPAILGLALAPSGGALVAGCGGGDVTVCIGDKEVASADDVARSVLDHDVGDSVPIEIVREGPHRTVTVELASRPGSR